MTTKHTPGPWYVTGKLTRYVEARIDGGLIQEVAACGPTEADDGYGPHQEANARLIAAAPDLLEALKEIMPFTATATIGCHGEKCREQWCHSCNSEEDAEAAAQKGCDAWAKARAAIARATGEQP